MPSIPIHHPKLSYYIHSSMEARWSRITLSKWHYYTKNSPNEGLAKSIKKFLNRGEMSIQVYPMLSPKVRGQILHCQLDSTFLNITRNITPYHPKHFPISPETWGKNVWVKGFGWNGEMFRVKWGNVSGCVKGSFGWYGLKQLLSHFWLTRQYQRLKNRSCL